MRDDLLDYYERELTYIRKMAVQFAAKYPKIASRLQLEPDKCEDPHVERILEGFSFLAARVHLKIDDDFPEITEAMMSVVYPQFVRPIPSMSIVEFQLDHDKGKVTTGFPIARGSMLYSRPVNGVPCKFRTCYDTTLWPLTVTAAEWKTPDRLQATYHRCKWGRECRCRRAARATVPAGRAASPSSAPTICGFTSTGKAAW